MNLTFVRPSAVRPSAAFDSTTRIDARRARATYVGARTAPAALAFASVTVAVLIASTSLTALAQETNRGKPTTSTAPVDSTTREKSKTEVPGVVKRVRVESAGGIAEAMAVESIAQAHTAQLLPIDDASKLIAAGDAAGQTDAVLVRLDAALRSVGAKLDHAVKLNVYVASNDVVAAVKQRLENRFQASPPVTTWVTTRLPIDGALDGALVAIDAIATTSVAGEESQNKSSGGPAASSAAGAAPVVPLGPAAAGTNKRLAAAAVLPVGSRVYIAGQAEKGDLRTATRNTLASLRATLKYLELSDSQIVQIKSFIMPMADVAAAEQEVLAFFGNAPVPPLVWVEWQSSATTPIEIELIAAATPAKDPAAAGAIEFLTPPGMTTPTIYSRLTRVHHPRTIYTGGMWGPAKADGATQVTEIFKTLTELSTGAGGDLLHLAKATYYVSDNDASQKLNELRPKYYDPKRPPAASKATVRGVALPDRSITIDMISTSR